MTATSMVGIVGLGQMGGAIATRLLSVGYEVYGYDLEPQRVATLQLKGLKSAGSAEEVAKRCKTVLLLLPTPAAVTDLSAEDSPFHRQLGPGHAVVDMGTTGFDATQVAARSVDATGARFLDCALGKTDAEAVRGELRLLVGAADDHNLSEDLQGVFQALGTSVFFCGGVGLGQAAKVISNMLANAITIADAEALALGKRCGLDRDVLISVLMATGASNGQLEGVLKRKVLAGDITPGFRISLALKDQRLALSLAQSVASESSLAETVEQRLSQAVEAAAGELDISAMAREVGGT